ncbi:MAG: chloride channel protein [Bacteroidia bacterium]|nr:chloride channel protein [Bacteroidia bacterium]
MKYWLEIIKISKTPLLWIQGRTNPKQFIIVSAILVGLTGGLAAVALKQAVHLVGKAIGLLSFENLGLVALTPLLGISLCVLYVRYFNKNKLGKGLSNILYSIARKSSILPKDQTYSHIITSALTVGLGGSAGVESPIVTTGSAIGSNFGKAYRLNYKERTLLLACGAAAGIAGAFNTPIAGVLFTLEVLLVEANISAFIPILIAAASGALCSEVILGEDVLLNFKLQEPFNYINVPFYFLLGIISGIGAVYYSKVFRFSENLFKKFKNKLLIRTLLAGAGLYAMILLFPPLLGEGYTTIKSLSNLHPGEVFDNSFFKSLIGQKFWLYSLLALVLLIKPVATGFTIGGGGNGGNFAPSLFMGALLGFLFAGLVNETGITHLPVSNFALVAMAGILSGFFHAPLTGIFLIAEITGGYELIIPLMIVSALSYAVSKAFMPLSLDMQKLQEKEKIVTTSTDDYLLSSFQLESIIEKDFSSVSINCTLGDLVEVISNSKRNVFPVLDNNLNLKGLVTIDDIREVMFKQEFYTTVSVRELMHQARQIITEKDDIRSALKLFDESHLWNIPVVLNNEYKGFISKSTILEKYREALLKSSIE